MYDVNDEDSFKQLSVRWVDEVKKNLPGIPIAIVVGNKSDLSSLVPTATAKEFAASIHVPHIEISVKDNRSVEEAFRLAVVEIAKDEAASASTPAASPREGGGGDKKDGCLLM